MKDLRLIHVTEDGVVELTPDKMHIPIKGREAAIQRATIAILNTAGTIIDAPLWGGSANRLFLAIKQDDEGTRNLVSSVIEQAKQSVVPTEPRDTPFQIIDMKMVGGVNRLSDRGYSVTVRLEFSEATSETIKIPETNYGS